MVDRTRRSSASDLQDEKMMSLGKLAAGLAHELNNPASAAIRGAKTLRASLSDAEAASRELCRAGLSESEIAALEAVSAEWWNPPALSLALDREGALEDWLSQHALDPGHAAFLVDTSITTEGLDQLAELVPPNALELAIRWVVAGSATRLMAQEVEEAAHRIFGLVSAVKRFTHLDKSAGVEAIDLTQGLKDTLEMLAPRLLAKGIEVTLAEGDEAPVARAIGSDLNQVWMNLLENAIDAVDASGKIEVSFGRELDRVIVRVVDDGPGIPPDLLSRVFDPFFTTKIQ
jgi:signal transduction histidine kinase